MIESPGYFKTEGEGELYVGKYKFLVSFQVFLINQDSVIYCKMDGSPVFAIDIDYSTKWSLKGTTIERNSFFATDLIITQLNGDFVELISNNNIIIGDYFDFAVDRVIYPLANLFDLNFEATVDDFRITVKSERNSIKKNISKYWGIPQISSELIVEKDNEPIDSFKEIANYIIRLLSLGTGRHLVINIQTFFSKSKSFTLLQNAYVSPAYIGSLLLANDFPDLLIKGIPILRSWNMEKFKDLRIILIYLNATDKGYVDDRVLKLVQCYEIIAHKWVKSKYKLTSELTALKQRLKSAIKDWKKEYPKYDPNGFWSGRIHKSLEWEKTFKLLEDVLVSQNLDLKKLDVDFSKLVELRHEVAHSGRFGSVNAIKDLVNGQFALRLYLLKILDFNGKIRDYRGTDWSKFKDISDFETMASA